MKIRKGDVVTTTDGQGREITGTVIRDPWGRAGNISIRTDEDTPRTFVRLPAAVRKDSK